MVAHGEDPRLRKATKQRPRALAIGMRPFCLITAWFWLCSEECAADMPFSTALWLESRDRIERMVISLN
jgi:hypothetical protein